MNPEIPTSGAGSEPELHPSEVMSSVSESTELQEKLTQVDSQQQEIDRLKKTRIDLWPTIEKKLRVDWTYNSNAIEGSTLSQGDTFYLLEHGITVEGKPFKDFLDARNHAEGIDFLYDVVANQRPISTGLIKEINALLMSGVNHTDAINPLGQRVKKPATPGEYKKLPNHVLQPDGTVHHYVDPIHVPSQMDTLVEWIDQSIAQIHPVITGAIAHHNMVKTHPFDDGNGRGARILMNLILMKRRYIPAIVRNEQRRKYIEVLIGADHGDVVSFILFVADSLIHTQDMVLASLSDNA